jgi:hypothetical protein
MEAIQSGELAPHDAGVSPAAGEVQSNLHLSPRGTVMRSCRMGDRIWLTRDGVDLGYVAVEHVPHHAKVRLCLSLDRAIRIERRQN